MQLQSNLEIQTVLKEKVYQIIYFKKNSIQKQPADKTKESGASRSLRYKTYIQIQ